MEDEQRMSRSEILANAAKLVIAHLSNNAVAPEDVPRLIQMVFDKLAALGTGGQEPSIELTPAVPIRKSVADEYIVCLEDGKKLKMLKRHLMTAYDMTPEQYRAKWGLKPDYPMVAPAYGRQRRELALAAGLGRKPAVPPQAPPPRTKRSRARTRGA